MDAYSFTRRKAYDLLEPLVWMGANMALKLGITLSMVSADNTWLQCQPFFGKTVTVHLLRRNRTLPCR